MSSREQSTVARRSSSNRIVFFALACLVVPAIAVLSFLPVGEKRFLHTKGRFHSWGHFVAFGFVAFLVDRIPRSARGRVLFFVGSLLFGVGMELGEHLVFHSSLEWKDVLTDAAGVVAGTLIAILSAPKNEESA